MSKSKIVNIKSAKIARQKQKRVKTTKKANRKKTTRYLSSEERNKKQIQSIITILVIVILMIICGYYVYKIGVLKMDEHKLNKVNMDLHREKAMLEEELKNVQDLEYVEEEAREKLNLILPGEVIYKFSDDKKGK